MPRAKKNPVEAAAEAMDAMTDEDTAPPDAKVIHRTESLLCKLTLDELRAAGDELARAVQDIGAETDRQTEIKAQMKARLSELEARKTQLAIKVSRREEYRDVQVHVIHDYARGVVTSQRQDTCEFFHERPMEEHERQAALPGVSEATDV